MDLLIIIILVFFTTLWFILHPGKYSKEQKAMIYGVNHAHRGLHTKDGRVPENSIQAFKLAVDNGYGIELDILLSKDGQVTVFHDDTLDRVCGVHGRVDDFTFEELKTMKLLSTEEGIPSLEEVLQVVKGKVPLIIEIKTGPRNDELCLKAMEILRKYQGAYCIESFNPFIVAWFRKNAPKVLRGQLVMQAQYYGDIPKWQSFIMSNLLANVVARPQFIANATDKKGLFVKIAENLGALKVAWTVNDTHDFKAFQNNNEAVIFEFYQPEPKYI